MLQRSVTRAISGLGRAAFPSIPWSLYQNNHNHFVGTVLKEGRNLTVFDTENVRENEWCEKTKCILK